MLTVTLCFLVSRTMLRHLHILSHLIQHSYNVYTTIIPIVHRKLGLESLGFLPKFTTLSDLVSHSSLSHFKAYTLNHYAISLHLLKDIILTF